ncbi:hypothetical protein ABZ572_36705 [Streptomyces sp. NPDC018338]|uniref:hypothetical protein n=1 Tax=Streptomyces sp. NPDC018338 TaxID=3157192 RepID=UPI0033DC50D5
MSTAASSPILTTPTSAPLEGMGAEAAPGAILRLVWLPLDSRTPNNGRSSRDHCAGSGLGLLRPAGPDHGCHGLIFYRRVLGTWRRARDHYRTTLLSRRTDMPPGSPAESGYGQFGEYVRLQCRAALGQFLHGLAYGSGLSLAGSIVYGLRHMW